MQILRRPSVRPHDLSEPLCPGGQGESVVPADWNTVGMLFTAISAAGAQFELARPMVLPTKKIREHPSLKGAKIGTLNEFA